MSAHPALVLHEVVRTFGAVRALDGVTLQAGRGEVLGLLGHNGAGKTTTVRLLAGLLAPTSGSVRVHSLDPVADGVSVRRRLGVLPSEPPVDARLTARHNLSFAGHVFGLPRDSLDERIAASLAAFELTNRADERVEKFSAGMRQRLALARVLLPEPELLLLDEPTASLDPLAVRQVRRLIAELSRSQARTIVLCTHDLAEAQQLCDRVAVLDQGQVVAYGSPSELAHELSTGGVELEVGSVDVQEAHAVAEALASSVELTGRDTLHCTGVARDDIPKLVRQLVAAGTQVYSVRMREPSLEDVYVSLYTERDTERTEGQA